MSCAPTFFEDEAPDFEGAASIEKDLVAVVTIVVEDTKICLIDLLGRLPTVRRRAARTHNRRAERQVPHLCTILPDEAAEQLEVAEHAVVERVEPPAVDTGATEEGRGMGCLNAKAEHPRAEEAARAVAVRWEIS